jgi:hypothetical protein
VKQVASNSLTLNDFTKYLAIVQVWFSEANVTRILYGPSMSCSCTNVNHATADVAALNREQHRNVLLHVYGGNCRRILQPEMMEKLQEDHAFLDEYAACMRAFAAATLPCNQHRRDICMHLARWIHAKIRYIHENYRCQNLEQWERTVRRELFEQTRVHDTLNYQLRQANERLAQMQSMYELLLRKNTEKPAILCTAVTHEAQTNKTV